MPVQFDRLGGVLFGVNDIDWCSFLIFYIGCPAMKRYKTLSVAHREASVSVIIDSTRRSFPQETSNHKIESLSLEMRM